MSQYQKNCVSMYMSTSWCMSMSMPTSMSGVYACSHLCVYCVYILKDTHTHIYIKKKIYIYIYIYTIVHCKACMRYACTNVCVRTSLARGSRGSLPLFFIQHLCRGTEGLQGSSVHRSSPLQPRKTYLHRPVVGSWRGTHFRSLFTSFRATSFLCV